MNRPVNLSKKSIQQIIDFVDEKPDRIRGTRFHALYNLIQKKGEIIRLCKEDSSCEGIKALRFTKTQYIGIIHYPTFKNKFYPCKTRAIIFTIE